MREDSNDLPPYPTMTDSQDRLFEHLASFRAWIEGERWRLIPLLPQAAVDAFEPIPEISQISWEPICVVDKYLAFVSLRKFREEWDATVRAFDGAWDSRGAVRRRFELVLDACLTLDSIFVHPEQREHQDMQKEISHRASPYDDLFEEWEI
jgi:hypothetical protein